MRIYRGSTSVSTNSKHPFMGNHNFGENVMTDLTPINPTTTIVALALTNVLTDIWHEQNKHKDIGDHPEEFRKFCESVLYSALSKDNTYGK